LAHGNAPAGNNQSGKKRLRKHQKPSSRLRWEATAGQARQIPSSKHQSEGADEKQPALKFGAWKLELFWSLDVGVWSWATLGMESCD